MDLRKHMLSNTIRLLTISKIVPIAPSNGLLITRDSIILSKVKKCLVIYVEMNHMRSVNHALVSLSSVNSLIMSVRRVGVHQQRHQRPAHQLKHTRWRRLPLPFTLSSSLSLYFRSIFFWLKLEALCLSLLSNLFALIFSKVSPWWTRPEPGPCRSLVLDQLGLFKDPARLSMVSQITALSSIIRPRIHY